MNLKKYRGYYYWHSDFMRRWCAGTEIRDEVPVMQFHGSSQEEVRKMIDTKGKAHGTT